MENDHDVSVLDISNLTLEHVNKANYSLLSLPAELRNRISWFTLIKTKPIKVCTHSKVTSGPKHEEPGLLRTCQQIRKEYLNMYYQRNIFSLHCLASEVPTLKGLESKVHMMRLLHIYVTGQCSHDGRYFEMDMREEAGGHELTLIKHSGAAWKKGKQKECAKVGFLVAAREYLAGITAPEGKLAGLTAETLHQVLGILTKCNDI